MKSAKLRAAAGLTFFIAFCDAVPNDFHAWWCGLEKRAGENAWAPYVTKLSTGGVFRGNFTGIVHKYWIIDASLTRCLTAFKTENPNARKKTKFSRRGYHFSFLPLVVSHDRFSRHNQVSPGDSSAESWLCWKIDTLDQVRSPCEKARGQWSVQLCV